MRKGSTSFGACKVRCCRWLFGNKIPVSLVEGQGVKGGVCLGADDGVAVLPHGGPRTFHHKSTCPNAIDFWCKFGHVTAESRGFEGLPGRR